VLPKGDPDISASWPGGLFGGALVPAVVVDPSGPRHFVSNTAYNHYSMLRTIEDAWGLPELAFTSDHAQVATMNKFLARYGLRPPTRRRAKYSDSSPPGPVRWAGLSA